MINASSELPPPPLLARPGGPLPTPAREGGGQRVDLRHDLSTRGLDSPKGGTFFFLFSTPAEMLPGPCHQQGSSGDIPLRLTRRRPLGAFAEGPHCQAQRRARDHLRGPPLESSAPIGMGPDRSAPSLSAYKPRFTTARRFGPTAERRKWGMPGRNDAGSPSLFASNQKSFESFPWVPPERSSTRFSQARAGLDLRPSQELLERKKKGRCHKT